MEEEEEEALREGMGLRGVVYTLGGGGEVWWWLWCLWWSW